MIAVIVANCPESHRRHHNCNKGTAYWSLRSITMNISHTHWKRVGEYHLLFISIFAKANIIHCTLILIFFHILTFFFSFFLQRWAEHESASKSVRGSVFQVIFRSGDGSGKRGRDILQIRRQQMRKGCRDREKGRLHMTRLCHSRSNTYSSIYDNIF